ncbi:MAG: ferrous iron transporter B [Oscillospiraceae bacterium]|nr:ferrous iron transporter B [Oscillospiraceae bacterium]
MSVQDNEKILLMGNPNVGKSVFFTELTGIHAVSSNYAGTTVNFMEGDFKVNKINEQGNQSEKKYSLIDVPGTYSLNPSSPAEAVAAEFVEKGARAVICVLDASNLERNLCLALEIQKHNIPTIYALNLADVASRRGITINIPLLEKELGAPVVSTIAVKKEGIDELRTRLEEVLIQEDPGKYVATALRGGCASCPANRQCKQGDGQGGNRNTWSSAKEIARRVIKTNESHLNPGFIDKLGESTMKPFPGIPIAIVVMAALIGVVVGGGEALRELLLLPLVNEVIVPFFHRLFSSWLSIPEGVFLNILVGDYGIFKISFEWIIALILPYVFLFYVAFSFLEDSGYLPRISVLFDNVMRKLGVQGGGLLYAIMGFGCAVPAIIGTRAATTRKERLVMTAAICFAVPCISQTAALISLTAVFSWWMMPALALLGIFLFILSALITGKLIMRNEKVEPLILEVPNLLLPEPKAYGKKLLVRMKHFMVEAEIPMMFAIVIAAVLKESGVLESVAKVAEPLVSSWLGMPKEAVIGLLLGVIRREMSVAPLLELGLEPLQAFIGGAVSLMYLPCLSVFGILVKEFKLKVAVIISVSTIFTALFVGGLINHAARIFI